MARRARPNFVLILADDMGYGDLGCYGHPEHRTPHLDALAAGGVRFTDFHSNGALCSPTRAALVTGGYQQRTGIEAVVTSVRHREVGLDPARHETFARSLGAAGYATALFGKWHLGYAPRYNPVHHGFRAFRGFVSGNVDYFSHVDQAGYADWWTADRLEPEEGYTTDLVTAHGLRFIEHHRDEPFCLYLAHECPHYPYQGPGDAAYRQVGDPGDPLGPREDRRAAYREMIEAMDAGVGRIVAKLDELGLAEDTLVFFFSDNGPTDVGSAGPLRGKKGQLWEGGHREPAMAYWPGRIKPGRVTDATAIGMDLVPTMAALAGADRPEGPIDGVDLSRLLLRGEALPARPLFWRTAKQVAMREGPWKLVAELDGSGAELFHLGDDLAEANDLAAQEPARVRRMLRAIAAWEAETTDGVERLT